MHSVCTRMLVLAGAVALFSAAFAGPAQPKDTAGPTIAFRISADHTGSFVNWAEGQVEVAAQGFAFDKRGMTQARSTAFTILVSEARRAIATLQVDGNTTLAETLKDAEMKRIADDMASRLVIARENWDEKAGTFTVVGVMPIYGQHGLTYLGATAMSSFKPVDLTNNQIIVTTPVPRGYTPQQFANPYTGIIVDGDAALLTPCLFPRVMRLDGKELWGPFLLTPAAVISGPIRYASTLDAALKQGFAGERPLIITAVGNGLGCYPVVNLDDVWLTLAQQKESHIFNNLPIVITLGQ